MTENIPNERLEKRREAGRIRHAQNFAVFNLERALRYYRKKKDNGEDYVPRTTSKLHIYCVEHKLDPIAIIEGRQALPKQ